MHTKYQTGLLILSKEGKAGRPVSWITTNIGEEDIMKLWFDLSIIGWIFCGLTETIIPISLPEIAYYLMGLNAIIAIWITLRKLI